MADRNMLTAVFVLPSVLTFTQLPTTLLVVTMPFVCSLHVLAELQAPTLFCFSAPCLAHGGGCSLIPLYVKVFVPLRIVLF